MRKVLNQAFFKQPTLLVTKALLGKFLVKDGGGGEKVALMINEVEAYDGFKDEASHAHRGKTLRNAVMFGPGGFWYVYFCYGVHFMLNIVTGPADYPAAVLIRGAGEICGPGRLTKFLGIDKGFNCKKAGILSGLWVEDRGVLVKQSDVAATARIGVSYAGPVWAKKEYRFVFKN